MAGNSNLTSENLTIKTLNLFIKSAALTETFLDFTYHPYKYVYSSLNETYGHKENSIKSTLNRLEKRQLLERETVRNGEILLKLTSGGELYLLKEKLKSTLIKDKQAGLIVVVFDIPESARTIRNILRRNLKEFGFAKLQQSVWTSKRDYFELLRKYLDLTGLLDYVVLFESYQVYGKKN